MVTLSSLWTTDEVWDVPDGWQQGRGAWGGLVVGQILTRVSAHTELPPVAIHVSMAGPVLLGSHEVRVDVVREGRSTSLLAIEVRDSTGQLTSSASVTCGATRQSSSVHDVPALPSAQWNSSVAPQAASVPLGPPVAPAFTKHLDFRPVSGFPYGKSQDLTTCGWVGLGADSADTLSPALVGALADAWWVASIVGLGPDEAPTGPRPTPMATIEFWASLPALPLDESWDPSIGLWHEGRVLHASAGYATEERVLRLPSGRVVAHNTQVVAVGS